MYQVYHFSYTRFLFKNAVDLKGLISRGCGKLKRGNVQRHLVSGEAFLFTIYTRGNTIFVHHR